MTNKTEHVDDHVTAKCIDDTIKTLSGNIERSSPPSVYESFVAEVLKQCLQYNVDYENAYKSALNNCLLTEEEEAAMNIGIGSRPSQVFYQHARATTYRRRVPFTEATTVYEEGKTYRVEPVFISEPALKGGATIAYDYHTAAEGSVDIAYGYAICAASDYFCKARGRELASERLRNLTEMSGCITLPLKPRMTGSDVNDYVTGFMRRLLELLWNAQKEYI